MQHTPSQSEDSGEHRADSACPRGAYGPREKTGIIQAVTEILSLLKIATPDLIGRGRVIILEIENPRLEKVLSHKSRKSNWPGPDPDFWTFASNAVSKCGEIGSNLYQLN